MIWTHLTLYRWKSGMFGGEQTLFVPFSFDHPEIKPSWWQIIYERGKKLWQAKRMK